MSEPEDLSLTRSAPIPYLTKRPRRCENRPRIFISWHPRHPRTPLYAYFKDQEYQPRWGIPGPRIQWAFQPLGQPQKYEGLFGPKKFPISSVGVLREIYRKGCFATNIASSVKLQNLSTRNMEPYLADVLRAIYYAQDVIELPATPKSGRATKPVEAEDGGDEDSGDEDSGDEDSGDEDSGDEDSGDEDSDDEDSDDEDDNTSQLSVPLGVKGRRASKATSVGKGKSQMSQESGPPTGAVNSSGALGGKKRKRKGPGPSFRVIAGYL